MIEIWTHEHLKKSSPDIYSSSWLWCNSSNFMQGWAYLKWKQSQDRLFEEMYRHDIFIDQSEQEQPYWLLKAGLPSVWSKGKPPARVVNWCWAVKCWLADLGLRLLEELDKETCVGLLTDAYRSIIYLSTDVCRSSHSIASLFSVFLFFFLLSFLLLF